MEMNYCPICSGKKLISDDRVVFSSRTQKYCCNCEKLIDISQWEIDAGFQKQIDRELGIEEAQDDRD